MTEQTKDMEKDESIITVDKKSEKFSWTKDRIVLAIVFIILVIASVVLLVLMIIDKTLLFTIVRDWFIKPILSLHVAWRVVIFLGLMMLQSLLVPIPSELILLSGAIIFGLGWGIVIGVVGSMFSAAITYYLSKRGGRSIIDATGKKVGIIDRTIVIFDEWIKKWGLWAILVGRAVPVVMFDPISYAAGLANIKDSHYFIATFIGSIPRAVFYGILGVNLIGNNPAEYILELTAEEVDAIAGNFNIIFFVIFGVLVLMFVLANVIYYVRERKKKQTRSTEEKEEENAEINPTKMEEDNQKERINDGNQDS